jgi:MFS family permease
MTMTAVALRSRASSSTSLILLTMSIGVLIAQIDTSVVNLAVKEIGANLKAGVTALQWVVDAYNLVYASLLLTAGLYRRRHRRNDRRGGGFALHLPHFAASRETLDAGRRLDLD